MTSVTPVILKDSNHTSIHLAPFPVVARVVAPSVGQGASAALSAELSVAEHLARAGAPIVAPTIDVPPGPHLAADETMTLWQFVAHRPAEESDGPVAAEGLREIHGALRSYSERLPSFEVALDACRRLLQEETGLPALATPDKLFLLTEHDRLRRLLATAAIAPVAGAIPCRMIHLTSECSGRRFAPPLIRHISVTRSRNQDHVTEVASVGDVQTFQFSGVNGMMAFVRAVVCAAGMVLALAISFLPGIAAHPPIAIVTRAVIGVVACMMWAIWRRRGQEVRTDGSRIMWCPRRDRRVTMSWSQVEGIRERALRRRLELVDGSRGHLPLSYDLADFARLLEIARRNTPRLRERHVLMSAFRPHPGVRWLYLAAALFSLALAAAAAVQGELFPRSEERRVGKAGGCG